MSVRLKDVISAFVETGAETEILNSREKSDENIRI